MILTLSAALALFGGGAVYVFTGLVLRVLARRGVLDAPGTRSSHAQPIPRGGGLALLAGALPCLAVVAWATENAWALAPLAAGLAIAAAISFYDDVRSLAPMARLAAQALAVAIGLFALPSQTLVFQGMMPLPVDRLLAGVAWLWFLNLYNFMDGIDGLTGVETISIGLGIVVLAAFVPLDHFLVAGGLILAAAAAGFLPWNWSKARIFLGDVGSVPLGYMLGFLLLSLAAGGYWAAALILPAYYLADATLTLVLRLARRERVWEAHRSHFYQRAALRIGHDRVALATAGVGTLLIAIAVAAEAWSPWLLIAAGLLVAGFLAWLEMRAH